MIMPRQGFRMLIDSFSDSLGNLLSQHRDYEAPHSVLTVFHLKLSGNARLSRTSGIQKKEQIGNYATSNLTQQW